jgi:hypothetical protein
MGERAAGLSGDLVLVTHGLVCHSLVSRRIDLAGATCGPGRFANTSVTIVDAAPPWRCSCWAASPTSTPELARESPRADRLSDYSPPVKRRSADPRSISGVIT